MMTRLNAVGTPLLHFSEPVHVPFPDFQRVSRLASAAPSVPAMTTAQRIRTALTQVIG
jgi:hypothetical protein